MAVRNVTPFLFPAKRRASQHGALGEHLHSLADVKPQRNLYFFVCESQPLLTITSHGLPKRCHLENADFRIEDIRQKAARKPTLRAGARICS
jgi:hypothetical protein